MADFGPIRKIVEQALALDLANPNFSISQKESLLRDAAISLGTLDYFRTFPMKTVYVTTYNTSGGGQTTFNWAGLTPPYTDNGGMYIPFNDILTKGNPSVPEDQLENAYFLGVFRIERPYWSNYSNPSLWEKQMFGFQVSSTNFDLMSNVLSNTYDEISTGQPVHHINRTQNRVEILAPFGFGQLALYGAIGFTSPEYVEYSKVDYLCKFISLRFIESIIQARDGVKVSADFEISTAALQDRLKKLREEVDSIKNITPLNLAQWA